MDPNGDRPLSMDDEESSGSGDHNEARNMSGAAAAAAESASSSASNMQAGLRMLSLASPPNVATNNINTARLSSTTMSHQALLRQQAHGMLPYSSTSTSTSTNARSSSVGASISRNNVTTNQNNSMRSASIGGNYSHNNNNNNARETSPTNNISAYLGLAGAAVAMPPSDRHDNNNHRISTGRISFVVPEHGAVDGEDSSLTSAPTNGWCTVETNGGTPPSARSLHAAALLNGVLYVFGGYDGLQRVNTFHAFSFAEKRWSPVLPSANSANPPSPRDRHVALAFGNSFYVHGGFDGTSRVSDFWGFDFSSMAWREVVVLQGRPPSPRHSHAAVVHRHSLYIFGGYDGSYKSDLHEFDFTLSQWSAVPAAGRRPRARYRATAVVHKNTMILYGGHDGTRHLSDTHLFDFDTRTWTNIVTEGISPIPRDSHVSVVCANSMYLFGGSGGSAMNDLHELQLPSTLSSVTSPPVARWRRVKTSGKDQPSPRFCHVAVAHNEAMFVFGGYDGSDRLNDFIRFDFAVYDLSFEVPSSTILSEFRAMVDDETLSDITFVVEGTPVYAHKIMLMRCSYFRALFLGEMKESKLSTIRIEQVSHPIFLQILEYLYTDHLRIPFESAMELFEAADLFCIPRLKTMCEKRMLQSITVDNAAGIFHAADMHSASALRQKAKKYILSHFEAASKTFCFEDMGRNNIELVFELLQSR